MCKKCSPKKKLILNIKIEVRNNCESSGTFKKGIILTKQSLLTRCKSVGQDNIVYVEIFSFYFLVLIFVCMEIEDSLNVQVVTPTTFQESTAKLY